MTDTGQRLRPPYAELTPHRVLDLLCALGFAPSGELLQLNSYENRVVQVRLDDGCFVVTKFYRPARWTHAQILEEHAFAQDLTAAEIPVANPLSLALAVDSLAPVQSVTLMGQPCPTLALAADDMRMAVCPRLGGRHVEFDAPGIRQRIGHFLGRLHTVGQQRPFEHRRALSDARWGRSARQWLADQRQQFSPGLDGWLSVTDQVLDLCDETFRRVGPLQHLRLHGDVHTGNLLWTETGPHFVDLDDACQGPAVQDFWMLLDGDRTTMTAQLASLLEGYETFREFDWREAHLIEALRSLRIIGHCAWIGQRWSDPAFPAAFPWFGDEAYWAAQTALLYEQVEAMQYTLVRI